MSYGEHHTEDHCDKCEELVGKTNLIKVPFLFLDKNDKSHEDLSKDKPNMDWGYRQYYVCIECYKKGV
jgi:hypothetical protein